jgi:hypothetical protein
MVIDRLGWAESTWARACSVSWVRTKASDCSATSSGSSAAAVTGVWTHLSRPVLGRQLDADIRRYGRRSLAVAGKAHAQMQKYVVG